MKPPEIFQPPETFQPPMNPPAFTSTMSDIVSDQPPSMPDYKPPSNFIPESEFQLTQNSDQDSDIIKGIPDPPIAFTTPMDLVSDEIKTDTMSQIKHEPPMLVEDLSTSTPPVLVTDDSAPPLTQV